MRSRISPGVAVILVLLVLFAAAALFARGCRRTTRCANRCCSACGRPAVPTRREGLFPLGTDDLGRDLLSRILFGARASFMVAILSVSVSLVVGTALGLLAGWFRGWTATVIMRLVDTMLSVPAILLAVLTVAVLGPSFLTLILVLGLTRWPRYTRVCYASTLQVASLPYIQAAEMAGAGAGRILLPAHPAECRRAAAGGCHQRVRLDDPVRGRVVLSWVSASSRPRRVGARS